MVRPCGIIIEESRRSSVSRVDAYCLLFSDRAICIEPCVFVASKNCHLHNQWILMTKAMLPFPFGAFLPKINTESVLIYSLFSHRLCSVWRGGSDSWQIFQFIWSRKSDKLNSLTAKNLLYLLVMKVGFRLGLRLFFTIVKQSLTRTKQLVGPTTVNR